MNHIIGKYITLLIRLEDGAIDTFKGIVKGVTHKSAYSSFSLQMDCGTVIPMAIKKGCYKIASVEDV